jgi:hypothetical protein
MNHGREIRRMPRQPISGRAKHLLGTNCLVVSVGRKHKNELAVMITHLHTSIIRAEIAVYHFCRNTVTMLPRIKISRGFSCQSPAQLQLASEKHHFVRALFQGPFKGPETMRPTLVLLRMGV